MVPSPNDPKVKAAVQSCVRISIARALSDAQGLKIRQVMIDRDGNQWPLSFCNHFRDNLRTMATITPAKTYVSPPLGVKCDPLPSPEDMCFVESCLRAERKLTAMGVRMSSSFRYKTFRFVDKVDRNLTYYDIRTQIRRRAAAFFIEEELQETPWHLSQNLFEHSLRRCQLTLGGTDDRHPFRRADREVPEYPTRVRDFWKRHASSLADRAQIEDDVGVDDTADAFERSLARSMQVGIPSTPTRKRARRLVKTLRRYAWSRRDGGAHVQELKQEWTDETEEGRVAIDKHLRAREKAELPVGAYRASRSSKKNTKRA